ncbi:DUF5801 repeats-in-toxin domain-containing protein, partial [Croceicoccus gelatinilyticus]|uniref:DUF5801 repeats-in-toxin domain-containing protein n=1 Tax=Croceicoccus gelatinilyticus TaxID=2835536 RepID=UPI001BCD5E96
DETDAGEAFVSGPISATSAASIISASLAFGADDAAGDPVYTIDIVGNGSTSLMTSDGDLPITLEQTSASVITGTYNGGADTAFTIEINDDGTLTVTQYAALEHADATDDNDTLDLAGLIDATVTITDNDGDTDSGTVAVGAAVTFYDDGPAVTNVALGSSVSVDETDAGEAFVSGPISATSAASIISASLAFGADDAAGDPVYTIDIVGNGSTSLMTSDGDLPITLEQTSASVITGTYNGGADTAFTVEINDDGTLTVTQYAALEHADATDDNDTLDLAGLIDATVTITDNDGDTDSGTVAVGAAVTFYDDGPAVTNVALGSSVSVDETDAGEAFVSGPISATSAASIISASLAFGADDAAGDPVYTIDIVGNGSTSLMTSDGDLPITLEQTSASVITGTYNGGADTAFTIEINDDGTLTVTQYAALEHADATDDNDTLDLAGLIDATVTITDNDGDTDSGTVAVGAAVTFYDDGPAVTNVALGSSVSVDETDAGEAFVSGPISATSAASIISASLAFGADDAAGDPVYTIDIVGNGSTSLMTSDGDLPITLEQTSASVITGTYNGGADTAFTVEINDDGTLTVTQYAAL